MGVSKDYFGNHVAGHGEVTITIKDNKIVECVFKTFDSDGVEKDRAYIDTLEKDERNTAYNVYRVNAALSEAIVKNNDLKNQELVDVATGATTSYNEFIDAVQNALDKAKK